MLVRSLWRGVSLFFRSVLPVWDHRPSGEVYFVSRSVVILVISIVVLAFCVGGVFMVGFDSATGFDLLHREGFVIARSLMVVGAVTAVLAVIAGVIECVNARARRRGFEKLIKVVNLIGRGDYSVEPDCDCQGELFSISEALKNAICLIKERSLERQYINNVVDTMEASLIVVAPDGTISTMNQATTRLLGYSEDELLGQPFAVVAGKRIKGSFETEDIRYMKKDGSSVSVHFSSSELVPNKELAESGVPLGMVCVARDISEHVAVQDALKSSEGKLNAILQAIADYIIMVDRDKRIMWANEAVTSTFGFDIIGKKCHETLFDNSAECGEGDCPIMNTFDDQIAHTAEINIGGYVEGGVDLLGDSKVFECTSNVAMRDKFGKVTAVIEVCRNITEYRRAEQALVQNAKLASLGELGAGIAHELNSPLAGILSLSEVMLSRMDSADPNYLFVEKIKDATVRSKHIIMDLMSYSRPGAGKWRPLSVNDAIHSVLSLFISELKTFEIKIEEELATELPEVVGNKGQLMEVFLNIIKNAKDSIEGKGTVVVKTSSFKADGSEFVAVEFIDNGPGMDEDVMQKIFDPFYTTKEKGGGMNIGLGLSISKGIIEAHGGEVVVESAIGAGARFRLLFPAAVERDYADQGEVANG